MIMVNDVLFILAMLGVIAFSIAMLKKGPPIIPFLTPEGEFMDFREYAKIENAKKIARIATELESQKIS